MSKTHAKKKIVAIIGPTGVGKSTLAVKIACAFNGEVVGCDSRQVYRYMDIGTAKPFPEEIASVPHHLVDIIYPDETLSLAEYQQLAYHTIDNIMDREKLPLLVGGTGQYFWAVVEGWEVPRVPPDLELRRRLEKEAIEKGREELYEELRLVDPESARKIDSRNVRRVIRALEVFHSRGVPFSSLQNKKSSRYETLVIGLTMERKELYRRVDKRVDDMIYRELVGEVKKLLEMGYGFELTAMSGIGYKQIGEYLQGKISLREAIQQIKFETHRYVRQQYTWFRLKDERIHWFNVIDNVEPDIFKLVTEHLVLNR